MSKPIKLTEENIAEAIEKFTSAIRGKKFRDGKIDYKASFDYDGDDKVYVNFKEKAFLKMYFLLQEYNSEVAWHGLVKRIDDTHFQIADIVVYPQEVTGATVSGASPAIYSQWLQETVMAIDDDSSLQLKMQGHSHVNMLPTPSRTDIADQNKILEEISNDSYYIFMIFNKSLKHTIIIFDLKNNIMYEDKDVIVTIGDYDYKGFIEESHTLVQTKWNNKFTSNKNDDKKENKKQQTNKIPMVSCGSGYDEPRYGSGGYYTREGYYGYYD